MHNFFKCCFILNIVITSKAKLIRINLLFQTIVNFSFWDGSCILDLSYIPNYIR